MGIYPNNGQIPLTPSKSQIFASRLFCTSKGVPKFLLTTKKVVTTRIKIKVANINI